MTIANFAFRANDLQEKEPGYIHGRIDVDNASLHFEMIQVKDGDDNDDDGPAQVTCGSLTNEERYENLMRVHAGDGKGYETVEWDGRSWLIYIFPFAR